MDNNDDAAQIISVVAVFTEIRFLSCTIWVIFCGVLKTGFSLVFNLQFLDFTSIYKLGLRPPGLGNTNQVV